jgi:hypothetical protein
MRVGTLRDIRPGSLIAGTIRFQGDGAGKSCDLDGRSFHEINRKRRKSLLRGPDFGW